MFSPATFGGFGNQQAFLERNNYKVVIKLKQFMSNKSRTVKSEVDYEISASNADELKHKIFQKAITFIGGRLTVTIEEGKREVKRIDEDITYEKYNSYILLQKNKNLYSLSSISDQQLREFSIAYHRNNNMLVFKVLKYGPDAGREVIEDYEKFLEARNRAGAPTEDQASQVVKDLKELHKDNLVATDLYWSMWATMVVKENEPHKREILMNNLPASLFQFFKPPGVETAQQQFMNAHLLGCTVAVRTLKDAKRRIDAKIEDLKLLSASLQLSIEHISTNTVAAENFIALNHLEQITDQEDIDHT